MSLAFQIYFKNDFTNFHSHKILKLELKILILNTYIIHYTVYRLGCVTILKTILRSLPIEGIVFFIFLFFKYIGIGNS